MYIPNDACRAIETKALNEEKIIIKTKSCIERSSVCIAKVSLFFYVYAYFTPCTITPFYDCL